MNKLLRSKWFIILVLGSLFLFFGRNIALTSLTESAIIIGMGIDITAGGYEVTMQSVVAQNGSQSESKSYITYTDTSSSIGDAISNISEKMGLTITLSHCSVMILSEKALGSNINEEIQSLVDSYYLTLQAVIVSTSESPKDIFSLKIPITTSTSSYLNEILIISNAYENLTHLYVKDFFVDNYTKSKISSAAFVEKMELPENTVNEDSSSSSSSGSKKMYSLNLSKSLIFGEGIQPFVVEKEVAEIVNFYKSNKSGGTLEVDLLDGSKVIYEIIKASGKMKFKDGKIEAKLNFVIVIRDYIDKGKPVSLFIFSQDEKKILLEKTEEAYAYRLKSAFSLSKIRNADFFQLEDIFYQNLGYKWSKPDNFLQNIEFIPNVNVTLKRG